MCDQCDTWTMDDGGYDITAEDVAMRAYLCMAELMKASPLGSDAVAEIVTRHMEALLDGVDMVPDSPEYDQ